MHGDSETRSRRDIRSGASGPLGGSFPDKATAAAAAPPPRQGAQAVDRREHASSPPPRAPVGVPWSRGPVWRGTAARRSMVRVAPERDAFATFCLGGPAPLDRRAHRPRAALSYPAELRGVHHRRPPIYWTCRWSADWPVATTDGAPGRPARGASVMAPA